jgi:hypothetical protein
MQLSFCFRLRCCAVLGIESAGRGVWWSSSGRRRGGRVCRGRPSCGAVEPTWITLAVAWVRLAFDARTLANFAARLRALLGRGVNTGFDSLSGGSGQVWVRTIDVFISARNVTIRRWL